MAQMRVHNLTALCLALVPTFAPTFALAEGPYRIGPGDQLAVSIHVRDSGTGEIEGLGDLPSDLVIDVDGDITVALVGRVPAVGQTKEQIVDAVETKLIQSLPLEQTPIVTVGVARYAPVFLRGEVEAAGAYDYFPGMNVMQAVALAGGERREEARDLGMGEVAARGALRVLLQTLADLEVAKLRIEAELAGAAEIDGARVPTGAEWAVPGHQALLDRRQVRYAHEVASFDATLDALEQARALLSAKLETNADQLDLARAEMDRQSTLAERGLLAASATFDRVRYVSEVESRILDIERAIIAVDQDLEDAKRRLGSVDLVRQEELSGELQRITAQIAEVRTRIETQMEILTGEASLSPSTLLLTGARRFEYWLTRVREGGAAEPVALDQVLMPGDVIEIRAVLEPSPAALVGRPSALVQ